MQHIKSSMRCRHHLGLFVLLAVMNACGPSARHKIITDEKGFIQVDLEEKVEPSELLEVAHYYYDPEHLADGVFMINFFVSSHYPDYPETPWATVWMNGRDFDVNEPEVSLRINGTRTQEEKQKLMKLSPNIPGIKGKWYFNEPMLESVYFLVENEEDTLMLVYDAKEYYEIVGEKQEDNVNFEEPVKDRLPDFEEKICPGPGADEYRILPYPEPKYRINKSGELILLNRWKSWKDTSCCILQPIP